jgi:hypothetical protein
MASATKPRLNWKITSVNTESENPFWICVSVVQAECARKVRGMQIIRTHKFSASEVRTARFTESTSGRRSVDRCCPGVGKKELTQKVLARMLCPRTAFCRLTTHVKNKQLVELSVRKCAGRNKRPNRFENPSGCKKIRVDGWVSEWLWFRQQRIFASHVRVRKKIWPPEPKGCC